MFALPTPLLLQISDELRLAILRNSGLAHYLDNEPHGYFVICLVFSP